MRSGLRIPIEEDNMLCTNCKKREGVHTIQRADGTELCLCDGCYERLGGAAAYLGEEPGFFVSLLQAEEGDARKCPVCGTTLADYSRTGLVGCAACYETFREDLMPAIRRIHGKTEHEGKHPLGDGKQFELLDVQKHLRSELESALREKRMKDAERINRDIRDISRMIYGGKSGGEDSE